MTLRHLGTAAALVAAAVCAACGGTATDTSPSSPQRPSASPSSTATSTPTSQLHLSTVKLRRDANVGPAAINANGDVAWTEGPRHSTENRVELLRHGSTTPATVARSAWREGLINWVALSGPWVVYVDQSAVQGEVHGPNVDWVIHANNLDTKQKLVLARSPRANPWVPWIRAGAGGVTWATASPSQRADLWRWVPGTPVSAIQKVLSDTELTPDSLTPTKDGIVYLGPNGNNISGHSLGGDCWIAPYDGTAPRVLTHTALGMSCAVGRDTLVYSLHIAPSQTTPEEIADDPYEIWTQPLDDGAKAQRIEQGYIQARPSVGEAFLTWVDTGGRFVATFDGSRQRTTPDVEAAGRDVGADGSMFAYVVNHDNGSTTLRLVTVRQN